MRRVLPHPILVLGLLLFWLLLNQSVSIGHIILGTIVALIAAKALTTLKVRRPRVRVTTAIPLLFVNVLTDIFNSNIAVARLILQGKKATVNSGFIKVPLELRDSYGLASLAMIITATPGTIWVDYDRENNLLLMHILDLENEQEWIDLIKTRYESRLIEIFQ